MKIFNRIVWYLLLLSFIIGSLIASIYFFYINNLMLNENMRILETRADTTRDEVERFMEAIHKDALLVSKLTELTDEQITIEEKLTALQEVQDVFTIYNDISFINTRGEVVVSTTYNFQGIWASNIWFQEALRGKIVISNPHYQLDPYIVVIEALAPVKDSEGNIIGVVSLQMPLDELWVLVDKIEVGDKGVGYVSLLNEFNMYIAHPDSSLILHEVIDEISIPKDDVTTRRVITFTDARGSFVSAYAVFSDENGILQGWTVLVNMPEKEFLDIITKSKILLSIILVISMILIIIVSILLAWDISNPINTLKMHTSKVGKSKIEPLDLHTSIDELRDLSAAMNVMITDIEQSKIELQNYNQRLEKEVQERTVDLSQKVDELTLLKLSLEESKKIVEDFNVQLEKGVMDRTNELEKANAEINDLLQTKNRFVNQVAHDLRTPLTPIKILLPILAPLAKDDEKMQKNFKMIEQNFNYLETLVKDTLNIARLDSGKVLFNNELIDIKIIIDNIIENNESVFTKNKVTIINKAESTLVECDKLRIKEVMENIIMNAIKFMERDPKTLTFSSIKSDKDLTVSIQDSGIGIDKDKLKIIFDEFTKLDTSRHEHSSGLGLAICKRIIEKHKGIIWAESEGLGKGTTIKFSLPVKEQARDKDDTSISS